MRRPVSVSVGDGRPFRLRWPLLPGTTQANPVKRGRYRAEAAAQLTLAELERWITLEMCERYQRRGPVLADTVRRYPAAGHHAGRGEGGLSGRDQSERARRQEYRLFEGVLKQREVVKAAADAC